MNGMAEKILETTIRLFARDGGKVTMDKIAENASVSKVTLYNHFTDKDALYVAAGRRMLSGRAAGLKRIAASGNPLPRKLCDFMDIVSDFADSGHYGLCRELARLYAEVEAEFGRYRREYRGALLALIDGGLSGGLFREGLDRDMVFHFVDMGVSHYQTDGEYRARMRSDEGFRARFMRFFIGSLFADGVNILPAGEGEP